VRTADIVCGVLLGVVGAIVVIEGLRLGIGWSTDGPQPGFFLFYLGVALLAAAGPIVVLALGRGSDARTFLTRPQFRSVATVFVPAVSMVVLTHFIGLYVSGAVYLAAYMRRIGRHSWTSIFLVAVGVPIAAFLIFEVWFLVPLPKGPLETRFGY
jgi:hypothetical protein